MWPLFINLFFTLRHFSLFAQAAKSEDSEDGAETETGEDGEEGHTENEEEKEPEEKTEPPLEDDLKKHGFLILSREDSTMVTTLILYSSYVLHFWFEQISM